MKILKIKSLGIVEEYSLGKRATSHPQEFVKDIVFKNGVWTVFFSEDKSWFKSFNNCVSEFIEFGEINNKSELNKFI